MSLQFHPLRVSALDPFTPDAVRIFLEVPPELAEDYRYVAGQHVTVRYRVPADGHDGEGKELRRSYSLCAPPTEHPPTTLQIAVKRSVAGGFGDYAVRKLAVGDRLDTLTPTGRFHAYPEPGTHHVAIVAGSGITPVYAILADRLAHDRDSRVSIIFGNRTTADVMFLEDLADLKDRYGVRLNLLHVLSREDRGIPLLSGRIDADRLPELLAAIDAGPQDAYYLCGPTGMVESARDGLAEMAADRVRFELFESGPRRAPLPEAERRDLPAATLSVTLGGRTSTCEMRPDDECVLDAVLRARPDAPYSCTAGACGTCRAKVTSGAVEMTHDYALENAEKEAGFVLTCQSMPTTESVELDFDA
ncbi:2Fe-2S iron-sulfur cluster-binding protein [Actinospica robiniae]|uniref:2Fe-2S iron-sulfur cluster-binding protein n=1 Tax=Actinospica robiniae TaxID=304901 RepID=UPI000418091C|nr:2Fe-2S iron-sulfur cluster-binding protein [Actinospica robiniae]